MRRTVFCTIILSLSLHAFGGFFPYSVGKKTLENGLDVIVIPTPEFQDVISFNLLILAGARNEVEEGKSGLAHLFEHILFRHRWEGKENGYDRAINKMGAFNNAWTSYDVTYYHPLTFRSNLWRLARLEADRFIGLDFTEEIFKTESGAVLGEYRRLASNPQLRMNEVLLALSFPDHPYGHSTIGFLTDVEDMPNEYAAAVHFHRTYYRPNNAVLVVSGDVEPKEIFALARDLFGGWSRGEQPEISPASILEGPQRQHIDWEIEVPPRLLLAYRMPAFSPSGREGAVAQLLPELLAGETAPLFQNLRYRKRTVNRLGLYSSSYESFDPRLLEISALLFQDQYEKRGQDYIDEVLSDMQQALEDLKSFSKGPNATRTLDELKSKLRYDFLALLNSPANIALQFAWYYRFERDLNVLEVVSEGIQKVTPADVDTFASRYFIEQTQVIVTLSHPEEGSETVRNSN